jgi:hypothetical protein
MLDETGFALSVRGGDEALPGISAVYLINHIVKKNS